METKKFKIIEQKEDCVLLMQIKGNNVKYMVKDIENDILYMSYDNLDGAKRVFDEYDINKVREERKKVFEQWLKEFAEA